LRALREARRRATISAWAVASSEPIGRFAPRATTRSPETTTAPTGTSPLRAAVRAWRIAASMKVSS
jgi:hypothetical protein